MKRRLFMLMALGIARIAMAGSAYDEVLTPPTYTRQECEAQQNTVWAEAAWQENGPNGVEDRQASACLRYYPSSGAEGAPTALIFIDGDLNTNADVDASNYELQKNVMDKIPDRIADQAGMPTIILTRPGTFGSSGMSHIHDRRMPIESHLVDAAVTQLKERYGYRRISLEGHSGGGGLVGAMMTLGRDDIDCAVMSSGVTSIKTRSSHLDTPNSRQGRDETGHDLGDVYDPIDHVDGIVPDANRRVFVLADPQDELVSFDSQKEFHEKLLGIGVRSTMLTGQASDEHHHNLALIGQRIAGWCESGKTEEEIRALLNPDNA